MPELPEVETVMRGLEPALLGRRVLQLELRRKDLRFPFPPRFKQRVEGARIDGLRRRAKYILVGLDTGETLILHLGMTGHFSLVKPKGEHARGAHDHVVFHLDDGTQLVYCDPRRFGMMDLAPASEGENHHLLRHIGVEPLGNGLSADYLAQAFRNKKAPLKAALLDQNIIAGLGNIYVCEALHRARLSPVKAAGTLVKKTRHDPKLDDLVRHIRDILQEAIVAGGSTLQDYQAVDGRKGEFQQRFLAYGREGDPCLAVGCTATIKRIVQAGRSTFYCQKCQR
jgi:formamidopyrimidine-DNA glycosylase